MVRRVLKILFRKVIIVGRKLWFICYCMVILFCIGIYFRLVFRVVCWKLLFVWDEIGLWKFIYVEIVKRVIKIVLRRFFKGNLFKFGKMVLICKKVCLCYGEFCGYMDWGKFFRVNKYWEGICIIFCEKYDKREKVWLIGIDMDCEGVLWKYMLWFF